MYLTYVKWKRDLLINNKLRRLFTEVKDDTIAAISTQQTINIKFSNPRGMEDHIVNN